MAKQVDYSVYLVTGRDLLPQGKAFLETLEEAIQGGVTVVQIREKTVDTGEFLHIAQASKAICDKYQVPLIINDRVDIALAVGAGVHLGQDDMPVDVARNLLPPNAIVGLSCNTVEHARKAVEAGNVDYIGIGAIYETKTKRNSPEKVIGPRQAAKIVKTLGGSSVKSVAIGGIKSSNALRVLSGAVADNHLALDGVAVVSEIMAASDPRAAAERLAAVMKSFKEAHGNSLTAQPVIRDLQQLPSVLGGILKDVRQHRPVVHQITNNVVINQSANATLSLGASPIMATASQEMEDLSKIPGGLLINFGTISDKQGMLEAGYWANVNKKPVIFDPVGVGATAHRRATAKELLDYFQVAVIKGNAAEIGALVGSSAVAAKGVDSEGPGFSSSEAAEIVRRLALQERCIVVMTGIHDYVTDGRTVLKLSNGHPLLGDITGSGCMVGTAVATFCGAHNITRQPAHPGQLFACNALYAAAAGVSAVNIAAELAAEKAHVKGPGSFLPALIDELATLTPEIIMERLKVEVLVLSEAS